MSTWDQDERNKSNKIHQIRICISFANIGLYFVASLSFCSAAIFWNYVKGSGIRVGKWEDEIGNYPKDGGPGEVSLLYGFYHEPLST